MTIVHKSALLNYSAEQMFALVEDIEDYPHFLRWCSKVQVERDADNRHVTSTMTINFHGLQQSFTTRNLNDAPHSIHIQLLEGPFRKLDSSWSFQALSENTCKVDFHINYEFSNLLFEKLVAPVFDMVSNTMVDSFCQRAKAVYG